MLKVIFVSVKLIFSLFCAVPITPLVIDIVEWCGCGKVWLEGPALLFLVGKVIWSC